MTDEPATLLPLHPSEIRLLHYLRGLGYGVVELKVQAGYPVLLERVREQIKLV